MRSWQAMAASVTKERVKCISETGLAGTEPFTGDGIEGKAPVQRRGPMRLAAGRPFILDPAPECEVNAGGVLHVGRSEQNKPTRSMPKPNVVSERSPKQSRLSDT